MPVRTQSLTDRHASNARYSELKRRLVAEWRGQGSPSPSPDILEETDRQQRIAHVFVTWDEWRDFDAQTRSEMIVEALQEVKGPEAVLELTIAMGLTGDEARRIGR